eukprot:TRINITY_DN1990_c0_g1_i1.p1 TRINITY_DN1990_c0_g1~~TRINITY_DN1990_c0_g1_i1.p1  ORF type:complete len:501 (-),score=120.14 TRINITY_DN1990_c0_g1_i1:90-1592(-)
MSGTRSGKKRGTAAHVVERAATYVERHHIFELFESLVQELVVRQPTDPIKFLVDTLKNERPHKVILAGGPASGKGTQCQLLVKEFGFVHVSTGDLIREAIRQGTDLGKQAKEYSEKGHLVPDDLVNELLKNRLNQEDCQKKGWLLDGYPRTPHQASFLQENAFVADKFVLIELPDEVMIERVSGRRLDPETNKTYHVKYNPPPPDVAARCIQRADDNEETIRLRLKVFHHNINILQGTYSGILSKVDGQGTPEQIFKHISEYIRAGAPTRAPRRVARLAILGPPSCGKSTQTELIARRHHCVPISVDDLVLSALKSTGPLAKEVKAHFAAGRAVPDSVLIDLIQERVDKADCRERGWILDGFPQTVAQAKALKEADLAPSITIHMTLRRETAYNRITGLRVDPATGKTYHIETSPAPSLDIAARLVQRTEHKEEAVNKKLDVAQRDLDALLQHYGDGVREIDGNLETQNVFEQIQVILNKQVKAPPLSSESPHGMTSTAV